MLRQGYFKYKLKLKKCTLQTFNILINGLGTTTLIKAVW